VIGVAPGGVAADVPARVALAPLLIIAIGNPSRGDDALGPALLDALDAKRVQADGTVELLTDFQLQVEHVLDIVGRRAVLFVDAAVPGSCGEDAQGVCLTRITADAAAPLNSHALRPQAVLNVCASLKQPVPPAWLLAIGGESFELGAPLSSAARDHLARAKDLAHAWIAARRGSVSLPLNGASG
jgi:hydrogenase maturation protease